MRFKGPRIGKSISITLDRTLSDLSILHTQSGKFVARLKSPACLTCLAVVLLLVCVHQFPGYIRVSVTDDTGFFFSAPISDRWGRKVAIMVGCVIVIIATFVSTFSPRNMGGLIAGRAIVGMGQGIALPAGPTYISEIAPAESRGKIMSFW